MATEPSALPTSSPNAMRILWLMPSLPYPPDTGGKQDTFFMLREFSHLGHRITCAIIFQGDSPPDVPKEFADLVDEVVFLPGNTKPLHLRLLSSLSDPVPFKFRKYYSQDALRILAERFREGDLDAVVADHEHLGALLLDAWSPVKQECGAFLPTILRTPNVESTIVQKYAERVDNPLVKAFANREARKMKSYEAKLLDEFDLVAAISPVDQAVFQKMSRRRDHIINITAGVDVDALKPPGDPPLPGEVVYVGSFDWHPNVEGATWLVEKVWPIVTEQFPAAHLSLVGKKPPPYLQEAAGKSVTLTGWVESVEDYVARASCCAVPLWIGSGMRYKILEAFALGRAVVSTSLGAEGIVAVNGEHILIRDDPKEFAEAVIELLSDRERRDTIGQNARKLVEEKYSWPRVAKGFSDAIEHLLSAEGRE